MKKKILGVEKHGDNIMFDMWILMLFFMPPPNKGGGG